VANKKKFNSEPVVNVKKLKSEPVVNIEFGSIDRNTVTPCKTCRKRSSCLYRPRAIDNACLGFEVGDPYVSPNDGMYLLEDDTLSLSEE